jgi:hypothetical protein
MRHPPDDNRRQLRAGRAFVPEQAPTIERVLQLLAAAAPELGRWLSLGLALLTIAMLQLWRGARSGNGWLTLCALSRTLPLDERWRRPAPKGSTACCATLPSTARR